MFLLELIQLKEVFIEISKIQNDIIKSTKKLTKKIKNKNVIDDISNELLILEFKSDNSIKKKCLKYFVKKIWSAL